MTLSESASLTPEQLRVAVAERLGWKWARYTLHSDPDYRLWKTIPNHAWILETPATKPTAKVALENTPNYPESRDACAEFEKLIDSLPMDARSKYLDLLALTCEWPETKNAADLRFEVQYRTVRATATQRCRAFLAVTQNRNE